MASVRKIVVGATTCPGPQLPEHIKGLDESVPGRRRRLPPDPGRPGVDVRRARRSFLVVTVGWTLDDRLQLM